MSRGKVVRDADGAIEAAGRDVVKKKHNRQRIGPAAGRIVVKEQNRVSAGSRQDCTD